jgi:uncharacterized protein (TIGR03663 family)
MAVGGRETTEEWRLGIELSGTEDLEAAEAELEPAYDRSVERLERPLWVVTAERLAWIALGCGVVVTRLLALGARPLDSVEAGHALSALELLSSGASVDTHLAWPHLLESVIFAAFGASDSAARVVFALSGILLIVAALMMRRHTGRAGSIAFAALLALSPSIAYFSRTGYDILPGLAFAVVALAVFLRLVDKPNRAGAVALGVAAGLALAADSTGIMTGIFMLVAFILSGVGRRGRGRLRMRFWAWFSRRKALLFISVATTALIWLACESAFLARSPLDAIAAEFGANFSATGERGVAAGLNFYLPTLSLYEFLIVLLAALSAVTALTMRFRSRLAIAALTWSVMAVGFFLWTPARSPSLVLQMIVPMALLGALEIEYLHHTTVWSLIRYPIAALALLTLYVQVTNNFIRYAPDPGQPADDRRALLFWTEPTTTLQTPIECARVLAALPQNGARAFFASESPALRWYLRILSSANTADSASAIVGRAGLAGLTTTDTLATYDFELSDAWGPEWRTLSAQSALGYLFFARAWSPILRRNITIVVRHAVPVAPTVIFAPAPRTAPQSDSDEHSATPSGQKP